MRIPSSGRRSPSSATAAAIDGRKQMMRRATLLAALLLAACQTSPNTPTRVQGVNEPPVTFNNQVVRIFQRNYQTCHRPGEVAPFSLTNYRDAHARRDDIVEAVESRYMPPW